MASLFVYKMQVLPILNSKFVRQFNALVQDFIWKGKKAKLSLETLQANREEGGLGLVNVESKHKSLLFNWLSDCRKFPNIANLARTFLGAKNDYELEKCWNENLTMQDSTEIYPGTSFWHKMLHIWHDFNGNNPQNREKVLEQNLAHNSYVRVKNKPIDSSYFLRLPDVRHFQIKIGDVYDVASNRFLSPKEVKGNLIFL